MSTSTILIVDDEPQIRRVMRTTLSSNGYAVIEAKSGEEALEMVRKERPELVLLDVNMPDRKSTRLNSSHSQISYAVFCLKKKNNKDDETVLVHQISAVTVSRVSVQRFYSCLSYGVHSRCTHVWVQCSQCPRFVTPPLSIL